MKQQPDKLFRDKLYGFEKPVSGNVWKRISQNRNSNHTRVAWVKVAAAVALLAVAGFLIFNANEDGPPALAENALKDTQTTKDTGTELQEPTEVLQPSLTPPADSQRNVVREKDKAGKPDQKRFKEEAQTPRLTARVPPLIAEPEAETAVAEAIPDAQVITPEATAPDIQVRKTVTIVFDAEEVNQKYLTKKTSAEATARSKEASGLKRLLEKAQDQDPIGELRQIKNELLAFNFKEKQQREN